MALLASLPATRHLFNPTIKRVHGVEHLVIGRSKEDPGIHVERADELQDFMYTSFFRGITMDFSEFVNTKATAKNSEELRARTDRSLARARKVEESRSASESSSAVIEMIGADAPTTMPTGKGSKVAPLLTAG